MGSILTSIKKLLGIDASYTQFDTDLILHINSVFMILNQIGVGPSTCYSISSAQDTWSDFLGTSDNLELVKSYMLLKVRLMFDPPTNSGVTESFNRMINEYEWRLNVMAEGGNQSS